MDKQELIDAVRALYLRGEVEAVNVYGRLEHVASGAEIDGLLRSWDRERDPGDQVHGEGLGLYNLHQAQRKEGQALRYGRQPIEVDQGRDPRRALADSAEREAAAVLAGAGFDVVLTPGYHDRHDLTVGGALRVEVKASTWRPAAHASGRYQALWHNKADLLLWLLADVGAWVVIPCEVLGERSNLAIWSKDPGQYSGQWAAYLGAWHIVDQALEQARARGARLPIQATF